MRRLAVEAFRAIDAAGLARVDFLLSRDTGAIFVNEINTMPGFTTISMYTKMWEASGVELSGAGRSADSTRAGAARREAAAARPAPYEAMVPEVPEVPRVPMAWCLVPGAGCSRASRSAASPRRPTVAKAYDLILDADFDRLKAELPATAVRLRPRLGATGPAPQVACLGLEALSLWWQIQLDPESRALDAAFAAKAKAAIAEAERMTAAEPERAEAWFYLGAAYGVRAQWRVLRVERLAAARDGKRIKESLERALALDPAMHDAEFGIGMYRYYADVAPA